MSFDGSLAFWTREQTGLLSLPQIALIIRKTAYTVQELHNQQSIYQDMNPNTILLSLDGKNMEQMAIHLASPGVSARPISGTNRSFPANSLLLYMAPEQWLGRSTFATDQYALAVVAYELLTGVPPFQGPPAQLMDSHLNVQPQPPSAVNQRVSSALDVVLMNALAKRPEDRFPSIFAFAGALQQAIRAPESLIVSVPKATIDGNLRATLPINSTEALMGTLRTITLPQGRRVSIAIPKGAQDGQVIRLEGFGDPSVTGGLPEALLLTIEVAATETSLPTVIVAEPKKKSPISPSFSTIAGSPRRTARNIYQRVTNLPPRRRMALLGIAASILVILVVGGVGLLALLPKAGPIPYPPNSGTLALSDLLRDDNGGYSWPSSLGPDGGGCQFTQNTYHASATQVGSFRYCIAGTTGYGNFAYEIHMTILKGDGGGMIFRASGSENRFYYYRIGRNGSYGLYLYSSTSGTNAKTLITGMASAVHTGSSVDNLLAVVARGNAIDLYVNGQHVNNTSINDGTYGYGQVGVVAAYLTAPTEVVFSNAKVWTF